jgi:hypothetical protein
MSTCISKSLAIAVLIGASFVIPIHAESSTLRVTCDDQATGAEVSLNDKYKGECPIDIQVDEGKHRLKAVKKIAGKDSVFDEEIRIGDGVTKRIEVSFGAAGATQAPSIQIDQKAIAQQRYEAEMAEYNQSIKSCLPKYDVELRRLKKAVKDAYKVIYAECVQGISGRLSDMMESSGYSAATLKEQSCGKPSWDESDSTELSYGAVSKTDEAKALKEFTWDNANSWCKKQFTKPEAP